MFRILNKQIDFTGKKGFTSHQKVATELLILVYGSSTGKQDEYFRMADSIDLVTARK